MLERKQELEEQERQRVETEARLERERFEKLKQERVQRLLEEVSAYKQACVIREYVDKVIELTGNSSSPEEQERVAVWASWARAQADDLDPIATKRFLTDQLPD